MAIGLGKKTTMATILGAAALIWLTLSGTGAGLQAGENSPPPTSTTTAKVYTVESKEFSPTVREGIAYAMPYFEENDLCRVDTYTNGVLTSTTFELTGNYPITPGMVAQHPELYPQYIIDYYNAHYSEYYSGSILNSGISPFAILTWENVLNN